VVSWSRSRGAGSLRLAVLRGGAVGQKLPEFLHHFVFVAAQGLFDKSLVASDLDLKVFADKSKAVGFVFWIHSFSFPSRRVLVN